MKTAAQAERVADLRRAFDEAFAAPQAPPRRDRESFLLVRAAGHAFALRVRDLAGLHADRAVVPVPGGAPALLGLAGARGGVLPVFDFAALLGVGRASAKWRWIVVARGPSPAGFLVEEHAGYVEADDARAEWLHTGSASVPVVDLAAIVASIAAGGGGAR